MEKENLNIQMAIFMMVNGKMIIAMGKEPLIMSMDHHILENGVMD